MKQIFKTIGLVVVIISLVIIILFIYLLVGYKNTKTRKEESAQDKAVQILPVPDEATAIHKVRIRTEVIKYEADLRRASSKASFEVNEDADGWSIQVFEIVKNEGEVSHTATFGWYRVVKKTGEVIVEEFTNL